LRKGLVALVLLLLLFATALPHPVAGLAVASGLLLSRRLASRALFATVDWPLLLLFACLFVITGRFAATGLADQAWAWLEACGLDPSHALPLALLSVAASNTIGNVPMVMLLVSVWHAPSAASLAALALFSTFAGNLLLVGSLANIIVAERAHIAGYRLGFLDHARSGVPITVLSMAVAIAWFVLLGMVPL
jgi:Na+/H+ antiporter NhaD/arsenite permease-like protein